MDDTTGSLTEPESGTAEQVKQDEGMRQWARYEQVIGIALSGIEHEMTREREPPPAYRRYPRRLIKLTAHTTIPPRPAGRGAERGNGKRGGRQPARQAGRRTQHRTIRTQAMNRQTRQMTERKAIANERERESDTGMKQAVRPSSCP